RGRCRRGSHASCFVVVAADHPHGEHDEQRQDDHTGDPADEQRGAALLLRCVTGPERAGGLRLLATGRTAELGTRARRRSSRVATEWLLTAGELVATRLLSTRLLSSRLLSGS